MIFGLGWHQTKADEELLKIHGVVICKPHTEAQVSTVPGFVILCSSLKSKTVTGIN